MDYLLMLWGSWVADDGSLVSILIRDWSTVC